MKILIITDAWHPQINGVVRTYEHLNKALIKRGHDIAVISPNDFPHQMPMPGYSEIKLTLFPYKRLSKLIEEHKPDSIHIATEGPLGCAARKYCNKNNIRFNTAYHTQFPDYIAKRIAKICPPLYSPVKNTVIRWIRNFHAQAKPTFVATQSLEETLKRWDFKNEMAHLTRGVNLDHFTPGPKTLFNELQSPIALYVGRIAIEKNIEDFLKMQWEGSKVLVGDGPSRAMLSEKYPDAHFVGTQQGSSLIEHYRSADLFVFPSKTDTFGMVLIEAMACGLPIAAYDVTGPKDIVTQSYIGALSKSDLNQAAQQAFSQSSPQDKEKRAQYAQTHYTWDIVAEQFERAIT